MRKAIYLAAEAWRQYYGQMATHGDSSTSSRLEFQLPLGEQALPKGWTQRTQSGPNGDSTVFVSPDGVEYDSLSYAQESLRSLPGNAGQQSEALRSMTKLLRNFKEGHSLEPEPLAPTGVEDLAAKASKAVGYALSQLDDWLFRGDNPIVRDMSLYVYSLWVYRAERNPYTVTTKSKPEVQQLSTVDIPFEESYVAGSTWTQRLALEPRLPKVEGMQFVTDIDPEMHFLLKAVLLRPLYLPPASEECATRQLRTLRAYEQLCTAPEGQERWCALNEGPDKPGPFERGWRSFYHDQKLAMEAARFRRMSRHMMWSRPSLWETREVADYLRHHRQADEEPTGPSAGACYDEEDLELLNDPDIGFPQQVTTSSEWPDLAARSRWVTAREYCALETVRVAQNFDGIALARSTKPHRRIDIDQKVAEQPLFSNGAEQGAAGDAQTEAMERRAQTGLGVLGQNTRLAHRFDEEALNEILAFQTAERTQAFVRELQETDLMWVGELPAASVNDQTEARSYLQSSLLEPCAALRTVPVADLVCFVDAQRKQFSTRPCAEEAPPSGHEEHPESEHEGAPREDQDVQAYFLPCDKWRRPSDYVAQLVRRFETEWVHPKTKQIHPRPLKRDQALFVAQFADACNAVWDEEQAILEGSLEIAHRRCFNFLVLGQAGSGKTAVVQDICIPAIDFLFPTSGNDEPSILIVCSKWSQAENISTATHKAVTCHRAGLVGIQSFRNKEMLPGDKKVALKRAWDSRRALVIEEVSMVAPPLFNMLLYRSFQGRREHWHVKESEYDKMSGAFGRMPIVIQLGDFLQLKPTGSSVSLITNLKDLEKTHDSYPVEFQQAMKLFCNTPLCFEFQASNRFVDVLLRDLMAFVRAPAKKLPPALKEAWESIQLRPSDDRLQHQRFQTGHMIAIYWETVARWMMMRATRDASTLGTPLFLIQAADETEPAMPVHVAKKLMNKANPKDTGSMHGMLAAHLGMRVRLLEALDVSRGLVKDAEGEIAHIVCHPCDQECMDAALADGAGTIYLKHLPLGIWVRMDKYEHCPSVDLLSSDQNPSMKQLVFIEPRTSDAFVFREYRVKRTGFAISHGLVITATACQGRTMRAGVVIDCGRHESGNTKKEDGDWWLELYVMLSRATRLSDLLLLRAPPASWLLQGPPEDLRSGLQAFAARTRTCRLRAEQLAAELGLAHLLR